MNFMAIKAYQTADNDLLVEGSDQFGLVKLLYQKLLTYIYQAMDSIEVKDLAGRAEAISQALTIIHDRRHRPSLGDDWPLRRSLIRPHLSEYQACAFSRSKWCVAVPKDALSHSPIDWSAAKPL